MKDVLVKGVRKLLPSGSVKLLEEGYRKGRIKLLTARYGNPAKSLRVVEVGFECRHFPAQVVHFDIGHGGEGQWGTAGLAQGIQDGDLRRARCDTN